MSKYLPKLKVVRERRHVILHDSFTLVYGVGRTEAQARRDYLEGLLFVQALYKEVKVAPPRTPPPPQVD